MLLNENKMATLCLRGRWDKQNNPTFTTGVDVVLAEKTYLDILFDHPAYLNILCDSDEEHNIASAQ